MIKYEIGIVPEPEYYKGYEINITPNGVFVKDRALDLLWKSDSIQRHLHQFDNIEKAKLWIDKRRKENV
jgi:hypothetical protein